MAKMESKASEASDEQRPGMDLDPPTSLSSDKTAPSKSAKAKKHPRGRRGGLKHKRLRDHDKAVSPVPRTSDNKAQDGSMACQSSPSADNPKHAPAPKVNFQLHKDNDDQRPPVETPASLSADNAPPPKRRKPSRGPSLTRTQDPSEHGEDHNKQPPSVGSPSSMTVNFGMSPPPTPTKTSRLQGRALESTLDNEEPALPVSQQSNEAADSSASSSSTDSPRPNPRLPKKPAQPIAVPQGPGTKHERGGMPPGGPPSPIVPPEAQTSMDDASKPLPPTYRNEHLNRPASIMPQPDPSMYDPSDPNSFAYWERLVSNGPHPPIAPSKAPVSDTKRGNVGSGAGGKPELPPGQPPSPRPSYAHISPSGGLPRQEEEDISQHNPGLWFTAETKDKAELQKGCAKLKSLHVPGKPVFVVHVHDLATAAVAAEQPEVAALCIDFPTLRSLFGTSCSSLFAWLPGVGGTYVKWIAGITNRSGKFLTVDMATWDVNALMAIMDMLIPLGVVGFDLRDSTDNGQYLGNYNMLIRISMVKRKAAEMRVPDFVINAVMSWPGPVDVAVERANDYLREGATVVTVLWRLPKVSDFEFEKAEYPRLVERIDGCVGAIMQMATPGRNRYYYTAALFSHTRAKVARLSYGNQWPHEIRRSFQECVWRQFSKAAPVRWNNTQPKGSVPGAEDPFATPASSTVTPATSTTGTGDPPEGEHEDSGESDGAVDVEVFSEGRRGV